MRLPLTLSNYIGRHFFMSIMLTLGGVMAVVGLIDFIEMLRRTAGKENVPFGIVLEMVFMRLPQLSERVLPFAALIGSIFALTRLTRTHELVAARAAGVSVWQFLMPALAVGLLIGIFFTTALNPLSAAMMMRYEQLEGRYISGKPSLLAVSSSGLWLRQVNEDKDNPVKEHIIHALRVSQRDMTMSDVIVFMFSPDGKYMGRIDARIARLNPGFWQLGDVQLSVSGKTPEQMDFYTIPTQLKISQIQDSFASPRTMSFWQLPAFIKTLEDAGFSAMRHKLYWQGMLSSPLLLCAMILIAATVSLRLPRRGGVTWLIILGLGAGFLMYFGTNLVFAFGLSGSLPIILAAWAPPILGMMIGGTLLLHLEDG